jgi:hypothetical protein
MLLQASTEIPFDFAYFAKLYTVALICSHYNGTKEYKQHQQRKILRKFCLVQKKKYQSCQVMSIVTHIDR